MILFVHLTHSYLIVEDLILHASSVSLTTTVQMLQIIRLFATWLTIRVRQAVPQIITQYSVVHKPTGAHATKVLPVQTLLASLFSSVSRIIPR